jgi:hypothetical protein
MSEPAPASDLSETITNQRQERSCGYHASSKVIVQNVFQFFIPKKIDVGTYQASDCNRFVDFDIYKTGIETLTAELCSPGGYDRILQFLYVYHLIYDRLSNKETGFVASNANMTRDILPDIWAGKIPAYFDDKGRHRDHVVEMVKEVNRHRTCFDVTYTFFDITLSPKTEGNEYEFMKRHKLLFDVIKACNNRGLYIYLGIIGKDDEEIVVEGVQHTRHAVHIVSTHNGEIIFKNSWGDGRVYSMKTYGSVFLQGQFEYVIDRISFLVPIKANCEPFYPHLKLMASLFEHAMKKLEHIIEHCVPRYASMKEVRTSPVFRRGELVRVLKNLGVFLSYGRHNVTLELIDGRRTFNLKQAKKPVANESLWKQVRELQLGQIVAQLAARDASIYVEQSAAYAVLKKKHAVHNKIYVELMEEKSLLKRRLEDIAENEKKIRLHKEQIVSTPEKKEANEKKIAEFEKTLAYHEAIAQKRRENIEQIESKLKQNPGPSTSSLQASERNVATLESMMADSKASLAYLIQNVNIAPVESIPKPPGFRDADMDDSDDDTEHDHDRFLWVTETIGIRGNDSYKVWALFLENNIHSVNEPRKDYLRYIASTVSQASRNTLDDYFHLYHKDTPKTTPQTQKVKSPQTQKAKSPQTQKVKSPNKKEIIVIDSDEDMVTIPPSGTAPVKPYTNGYFHNGVFKPSGSSVPSSWISGFKDANNHFFEVTDVL